jgi:hypothetical protein
MPKDPPPGGALLIAVGEGGGPSSGVSEATDAAGAEKDPGIYLLRLRPVI